MRSKFLYLLLILFVFSCDSDDSSDAIGSQEISLRKALGISESSYSKEKQQELKEKLTPIKFENVEDAKQFIQMINSFSFQESFDLKDLNNIVSKGGYNIEDSNVVFDLGNYTMSVPCDSQWLDPVEGCDDGGGSGNNSSCGSGTVIFRSQSIAGYRLNQSLTYTSDSNGGITVTGTSSYISGFHPGISYTQQTTSPSVSSGGTVCFQTIGTLDYNISVSGFGDTQIYTQTLNLSGCFNPCFGGTSGLELYLQPAGGGGGNWPQI